jgi:hypothetical protein
VSLTYEQWPWQKVPYFLLGCVYLISGSAISPLLAAAQVTPYLYPNGASEDVYITGILPEIANVTAHSTFLDG